MTQKGRPTSFAERIEIGERWAAGQTDRQIVHETGRPLATVRKWRRCFQMHGRSGLSRPLGRPASGPLGQFPKDVVAEIARLRKAHPGWGPLTIRTELTQVPHLQGMRLPSRSRIAAFLKEKTGVRGYERREKLPQPPPQPLERPHQEWEVDAQGQIEISGLGSVSLVNVLDVVSRVKIASLPCLATTHADTRDYQLLLRRAFLQYGLPEQVSLDHDSVFYDNRSPSPFPTLLHLWLIGLGVQVRFIEKTPPQEHARIERHHQVLVEQAVRGQTFASPAELQALLSERIDFLNHDYPSAVSGGQAPLQANPQARQSPRPYRLEWEAELLDLGRVSAYLAKGRWFRKTSQVGMFSLGAQRYNARMGHANQTLEISFDPQTAEFVCLPERSPHPVRLLAKGLTKEALMGELDPLLSLPAYQLALPFSRQAWREMTLCQGLGDTP